MFALVFTVNRHNIKRQWIIYVHVIVWFGCCTMLYTDKYNQSPSWFWLFSIYYNTQHSIGTKLTYNQHLGKLILKDHRAMRVFDYMSIIIDKDERFTWEDI